MTDGRDGFRDESHDTGGHTIDSETTTESEKRKELPQWSSELAGTREEQQQTESSIQIEEYTTERRSLTPIVQLQWGIRTVIGIVVLSIILTVILNSVGTDPRFGTLVLGTLFLLGIVWILLRYRVWIYQVREDALYLERGVVTHVRTLVPYVRIQHVDTSRSPLERALGLSTLVVYTAGSRGADVSIPGLTPEEASDLQQRVKELAIEAEGGDAL